MNRSVQIGLRDTMAARCFVAVPEVLTARFADLRSPGRSGGAPARWLPSAPMAGEGGERDRLADLVAAHCLEHGVADLTLRRVASDVGTGNRMLLYYFGSKEGLIEAALLRAVARFPRLVAAIDLLHDRPTPLEERLGRCWREIVHPENLAFTRLFFEVFGLAAHRPGPFRAYLDRAGHEWTARVEEVLVAEGVARPDAAVIARQIVALWRGLQFDLLSSGDRAGVDRAHDAAAATLAATVRRLTSDVRSQRLDEV